MNSHKVLSAMTQILQSLARWPGVTLHAHRYGGLGIFVAGRELGQLHDCGLLDVSLTPVDRDVLLKEGRVHPHHTFPDSGWVTLPIDGVTDVPLAMQALGMAHARVPYLAECQATGAAVVSERRRTSARHVEVAATGVLKNVPEQARHV